MESKEIAVRGFIGSLATPMGRSMGVKSFQEKTASALGKVVSLEDDLIAFAKDVLKQRLSGDEIDKMFNGNVSMPVAEGDKAQAKPIPTTNAQVDDIVKQKEAKKPVPQQMLTKTQLSPPVAFVIQDHVSDLEALETIV